MLLYRLIKRLFDLLGSLLAIGILSPILVVISLVVKTDSPGPILFKQQRIGRDKEKFYIYKFRTMRTDAPKDVPTHLLDGAQSYITRSGAFLRKTSLDELPQLFNIFRGQMSFVGPRPALYNQSDLVEQRELYGANDIPVGLTGWAQVNGRDEIPIEEKARLDGEYVQKRSLLFDCKVLFLTVVRVFRAKGVVEGGTGSLEKLGTGDH